MTTDESLKRKPMWVGNFYLEYFSIAWPKLMCEAKSNTGIFEQAPENAVGTSYESVETSSFF